MAAHRLPNSTWLATIWGKGGETTYARGGREWEQLGLPRARGAQVQSEPLARRPVLVSNRALPPAHQGLLLRRERLVLQRRVELVEPPGERGQESGACAGRGAEGAAVSCALQTTSVAFWGRDRQGTRSGGQAGAQGHQLAGRRTGGGSSCRFFAVCRPKPVFVCRVTSRLAANGGRARDRAALPPCCWPGTRTSATKVQFLGPLAATRRLSSSSSCARQRESKRPPARRAAEQRRERGWWGVLFAPLASRTRGSVRRPWRALNTTVPSPSSRWHSPSA